MQLLDDKEHKINGFTLHTINTDKFKTNTLVLKMKAPLDAKSVTQRALLPYVLQSETKDYPTSIHLRKYLDDLYGATLNVDLSKKGEYHIITFRMEIANELYLLDQTPLLTKAIQLLSNIIFSPIIENGAFKTTTIDYEKRSLRQRIQAVYDDKMRYANLRLVEEMCKGEPYALHVNGVIEDIDAITPTSLYEYYQKCLEEDEVDFYIVGKFDDEKIVDDVSKHFTFKSRTANRQIELTNKEIVNENEVIEKQDVKQGKLNVGYRTNIIFGDPDYDALQVFNGIYGGFSHSKLFINVREKESLAYYAASRVESHKGLLMVMSGIEFANYQKAVSIIKEQMEAMKQGDFSDEVLSQTKAVIKNQLLETIDTSRGLIEVLYQNVMSNNKRNLEDWLSGIERVSKEEVVEVSKKIKLDTIYFLTGMEVK